MADVVEVTGRARVVRADNPGIMTLEGTNTWILREPGAARSVVVDPGPDDAAHLDAVLEVAGEVALVLYTHHHGDHTDAFATFGERTGAPAGRARAPAAAPWGPSRTGPRRSSSAGARRRR